MESEGLRAKVQDWEENSFAVQKGLGFMSAGGGKGFGAGESSIDRMSEDIDINLPPSEQEKYL